MYCTNTKKCFGNKQKHGVTDTFFLKLQIFKLEEICKYSVSWLCLWNVFLHHMLETLHATGQYADSAGSSSCTPCPAGSECSDPTIAPVQCLAGTYAGANSVACTACPSGTMGLNS